MLLLRRASLRETSRRLRRKRLRLRLGAPDAEAIEIALRKRSRASPLAESPLISALHLAKRTSARFVLFVLLCLFAVWIYTSTGFQFASQSFPVYARNTPISWHALKYCALDSHFLIPAMNRCDVCHGRILNYEIDTGFM
jgi:hypothetical protein